MQSKKRVVKTRANNYLVDSLSNDSQTGVVRPALLGGDTGVTISDSTPVQTLNATTYTNTITEVPAPGKSDPIMSEVPIDMTDGNVVTEYVETVGQVATDPVIPVSVSEHFKNNWFIYLIAIVAVIGFIYAYKKGYFK